jgi:acyl carrier protein
MTHDLLVARVLSIVAGIAGGNRSPADAGPDTPLSDGGFWLDSAALLEVILACEEAFDVVFDPETDLSREALSTVGTLAASIRGKQIRPEQTMGD